MGVALLYGGNIGNGGAHIYGFADHELFVCLNVSEGNAAIHDGAIALLEQNVVYEIRNGGEKQSLGVGQGLLEEGDLGAAALHADGCAGLTQATAFMEVFQSINAGDNPDMRRAQGVNVNFNKVLGLAISNGIVALAGALYGQYKGFADLNMGRGAIVIGLAAIFIGLSISMKIKPNFVVSLIGVVGGGVVYYIIYNLVILLMMMVGLKTDYLKMFSAIIVILFLAIPYLYNTYLKKQKPVPAAVQTGGDTNA